MRTSLFRLVVKRDFFEAFANGTKTIEYRQNKPPFTARNFWPGRPVLVAYHYDAYPHLAAVCAGFAVAPLSTLDDPIIDRLRAIYPRLDAAAAIALISLRVVDAWPSAGRRERETARAYPLCQF
jgi:hypothetical protein